MIANIKRTAKSLLKMSPNKLKDAYFGAFPEVSPGGFSSMFEVERLRKLLAFLDIDCVFDIGGNDGQYALQLRDRVGYHGRIITFEPLPNSAAKLRKLSQADAKWSIEEIAISDRNGFTDFNLMTSSQFSSISAPRNDDTDLFKKQTRPIDTIQVRCESLETAFNRLHASHSFNRPFLEMDTQGYDLIIARGAEPILSRFLGVQSELAVKRLYETSETIGEALEYFSSQGFELSALVPNNQGHFPLLIETDGLFIRNDLTVKR